MQDFSGLSALSQSRVSVPELSGAGIQEIAENPANRGERVEFSEIFEGALDHVSGLQQAADQMRTDIEMGVSTDLVGTMIASEKSSLAFQGVIQVRNRVVSAYETVYNMPI